MHPNYKNDSLRGAVDGGQLVVLFRIIIFAYICLEYPRVL